MRTVFLFAFLFTVSAPVLCAADDFHPLDVKAGLWETTWTNQSAGQMPIPADALANLTPEQRAKVEEAMKARGGGFMGGTRTYKSCVTKEKMNKDLFSEDRQECKRTVLSSSSHKLEMKVECTEKGMTSTGTFRVEATGSDSAKGSMEMVATGGGHTMNINSSFTSKYLGSDCGDVK